MIYWGPQAFSRSRVLVPCPPLSPSLFSIADRQHTGRLRKRDNLLRGEGERGWARSRIIWPQESMVLYKSFNTLWGYPSYPKVFMFILPAVVYNIILCIVLVCLFLQAPFMFVRWICLHRSKLYVFYKDVFFILKTQFCRTLYSKHCAHGRWATLSRAVTTETNRWDQ
jgi:hypothetical protein